MSDSTQLPMLLAFQSITPVTRPCLLFPPTKYTTCERTPTSCCEGGDTSGGKQRNTRKVAKRRRVMSAEARAKISAALKGRRKSDEHRQNLRRRFEGDQNPMYGRKMSAESRAKISRAMAARKQKKLDEEDKPELDTASLEGLREKAKTSRLLESRNEPRKRPGRRLIDEREGKEMDKILERVARFDEPPESVVKMLQNTEKERLGRLDERMEEARLQQRDPARLECKKCQGSGMVTCPECVGTFGVQSAHCETCFGAGVTFCEGCQGAGIGMEQ